MKSYSLVKMALEFKQRERSAVGFELDESLGLVISLIVGSSLDLVEFESKEPFGLDLGVGKPLGLSQLDPCV